MAVLNKKENPFLLEDYFEISVANFYGYDAKTGIEYYSGTLESHELTQTGETEKIKGGQDNAVLGVINKDKEISLKITDVKSRADIEAVKFGGTVKAVDGATIDAMHMPKNYTVVDNEGLKITLDAEPKQGEEVIVYSNKTKKMIDSGNMERSGKDITFTSGVSAGETVYVSGFKYAAKATDKYADITPDSSAPVLYVVIEVNLFDSDMKPVCKKQYHFPKAQLSTAVTKAGQAEKTKTTDETTLEIIKDNSVDYLGRIVFIYPDAA